MYNMVLNASRSKTAQIERKELISAPAEDSQELSETDLTAFLFSCLGINSSLNIYIHIFRTLFSPDLLEF